MPEITLSIPVALGLLALFLIIGAGLVFFAVRQQPTIAVPPTVTLTPTQTTTPTLTPTPITPTPTNTPEPTPTPLSYRVSDGDTCISIAVFFNVSVQSIVQLNSLPASCSNLFVGQQLLIPQPTPTPTAFPTATLSPAEATVAACETARYTVQENDTISTIATNYGVTIESIARWNGLVGNTVFLDQTLIIPLCERSTGALSASPTPTIPPPYAAPNLLLPPDGAYFTLGDDSVTLQWSSVGSLRENEFYVVVVEDVTDGEGRRLTEYVRDTKFIIPASFRPSDTNPHIMRWKVGTVRESGTDENGRPLYAPAGAESAYRAFSWSGVTPNE